MGITIKEIIIKFGQRILVLLKEGNGVILFLDLLALFHRKLSIIKPIVLLIYGELHTYGLI